jgi:hypothetical protein
VKFLLETVLEFPAAQALQAANAIKAKTGECRAAG